MTATPAALPPPPGSAGAGRRAPRWGVQTGLVQPRQPAFWLYVIALVLGAMYWLLLQFVSLIVAPVGLFLAWLLLILYIVPVVLAVRWLDLYEREPRSLLVGAFLWGALVSILFAGFANDYWGVVISRVAGPEFASQWSAALTAPFTEEIYKYLGIVVLYLIARLEFDDLIDGFVYGALVGLGFSVSEDVFYFIFKFGGDIGGVLEGFYVRVLAAGLYGHVLYTGLAGIGLAYFVTRRYDVSLGRRLVVAGGLLALAIVAHLIWNSPFFWNWGPIEYGLVKGMPFFIGLVVLLYLARRREHRALAEVLAGEVGRPGLLAPELELLREPRTRRATRGRVRAAGGREAERTLKRLQDEQIKLALVASAVDSADDARLIQQRALCQAWRARLWQIPGVTAALGVPEAQVASELQSIRPFAADRRVAPTGAWAWATPDQADPRRMALPVGMPLDVVETRGDWLLVRTADGWHGWTGAPYLATFTPPAG